MKNYKTSIVKTLPYILLLLIVIYAAYNCLGLAAHLEKLEEERKGKGYVSDEVWYVSSARNILIKVFSVEPSKPGKPGASVIFSSKIPYIDIKKIASEHNVTIVDTNYYNIKAIYVEAPSREDIASFIKDLDRHKINVSNIVYGWRIPDAAGIDQYLNLEHPPMVKYLIALSIMLMGDHPLAWRIPEIIAGITMLIALFFLARGIMGKGIGEWLALIIVLLASLDPITRALSSIGLLDIYVALFTVLALIPLTRHRYLLSIILVLIGATFKFSVLFALIPIYVLFVRGRLVEKKSFANLVYSTTLFFTVSALFFISFQLIASAPLIEYLGFKSWLDQSIIGAIEWHTSIKCVGAGCPPISTPLDWFIGVNPFPLYYMSNNQALLAQGFWPLWTLTLASILIFLPGYMVSRGFARSSLYLLGSWSGYIILWIIGGRTQYSFYSVQFVGLVYLALIVSIYEMIIRWDQGRNALSMWASFFKWAWRAILMLLLVETQS